MKKENQIPNLKLTLQSVLMSVCKSESYNTPDNSAQKLEISTSRLKIEHQKVPRTPWQDNAGNL